MTVKRNGDQVILKNGKVSCSCCEEPTACCMYPAATLVAGIYSYQDLPDAIDIHGIEYTKLNPPQSVAGYTQYYININEEYLGILEGEGEDSLWTYVSGGGPCLINGFNGEGGERKDQFADTYTIQYTLSGEQFTRTLTRRSLCCWDSGAPDGEPGAAMRYLNNNVTGKPEWRWIIGNCNGGFGGGLKQGNQDSPVGTYSSNEGTTTVS